MGRDNKRGKRGGRGGGRRFAAHSAEEIEQRNARLAEFDAQRARRRAEEDDDDGGSDGDDVDAQREAMLSGMKGVSVQDDGDDFEEKDVKSKGVEGLIDVENPNRASGTNPRMMKAKDLDGAEAAPMTRKEREEAEKARAAAAYRKRHEAGLTEEYKRDMAKLAEVRKRREEADAKKKAEAEAAESAEAERKKKAEEAGAFGGGDGDDKKKKKKKSKDIPKLDKIAIKKMKPAQMKEALKLRGLEIQGNKNQLMERLIEYEKNR